MRLVFVLLWVSLIIGTYVTGNVLGNWIVWLLACFSSCTCADVGIHSHESHRHPPPNPLLLHQRVHTIPRSNLSHGAP